MDGFTETHYMPKISLHIFISGINTSKYTHWYLLKCLLVYWLGVDIIWSPTGVYYTLHDNLIVIYVYFYLCVAIRRDPPAPKYALHIYQTEITQISTHMHMLNRYQSDFDTNTCISAFKTEPRHILTISDLYLISYQTSNESFIKPRLTKN